MKMTTRPAIQSRLSLLRLVMPVILGTLAVVYELGLGKWVHDSIGAYAYFDIDIVIYALIFPAIVFATLTLIRDWTAKTERAEQQAHVSERRMGAIMAASADAILTMDAEGTIELWNRGAEQLFGYTVDQMRKTGFMQLLGPTDSAAIEYRWLCRVVQETGVVRGHESTCVDALGHVIAIDLTATRLADDAGNYLGMSVVLRDVTDRKHREDEIRRLNATLSEQVAKRTRELDDKVEQLAHANAGLKALDQMRSEFVSVVSHQIRAPLTNMRGAAERMRADCLAVNATCSRMFAVLDQQVERLDKLVRDVLSTSRIDAGELVLQVEPTSILPIINQAVEQMRSRASSRAFRLPIKPGLPMAMVDRDRVVEILTNLLDNAEKYSPRGQDITIDIQADDNQLTVSIRDHGRGLATVDPDQLFNKFYRADSSDSQSVYGYGLGLYVCRKLVQAQGGRIWAENAPGGGAQFMFTLPVVK